MIPPAFTLRKSLASNLHTAFRIHFLIPEKTKWTARNSGQVRVCVQGPHSFPCPPRGQCHSLPLSPDTTSESFSTSFPRQPLQLNKVDHNSFEILEETHLHFHSNSQEGSSKYMLVLNVKKQALRVNSVGV